MDSNMKDLSIVAIIPLYNGEKYIEQAIRSVLSQTDPPDEFIIVDDGSTDDGPQIVKTLAAQYPLIQYVRKENGGQSSARNFGVENSTSELIALLDQDDYWYSTHLEELVKPFLKNWGIPLGWSYSNLDEIDSNGQMIMRSMLNANSSPHPKSSLMECLSYDMMILPGAALISREAFDDVGGFDVNLIGFEDDDLFLRMFLAGYENIYINNPLSRWRVYSGSTSYKPEFWNSRMFYFRKQVALFPPDHFRGIDYASRKISPKFFKAIVSDLVRRSILNDDSILRDRAYLDISEVSKHMSPRWKFISGITLIFMRMPFALRILWKLIPAIKRFCRSRAA